MPVVGEVIAFPDIEDLLQQYLTAALAARGDTATVHISVPTTRPDRFVLVPRVGGIRQNLVVDAATIGVECWASTPGQAFGLVRLVRALLGSAAGTVVGGVQVYRVTEAGGPANLPDPLSQHARYILTVEVAVRGAAI